MLLGPASELPPLYGGLGSVVMVVWAFPAVIENNMATIPKKLLRLKRQEYNFLIVECLLKNLNGTRIYQLYINPQQA
jgi:hypothetical protein